MKGAHLQEGMRSWMSSGSRRGPGRGAPLGLSDSLSLSLPATREARRGGTKPCWFGKQEIAANYASRLACRAIPGRCHITLSLTTQESSAQFEELECGRERMALRRLRRESCGILGSWVSGVWFITRDGQPTSSCGIV